MKHAIFRRGALLLPLLGVLGFGLVVPEAQADRDDRRYERHGKHHKHFRQPKHDRHFRGDHRHFRSERRHYFRSRDRVVERHYYPIPRRHYYAPGTSISVVLPLGTIVSGLPGGYISLSLGDGPYYFHGGNYFRPHHWGYQVVSAPPGHRW